MNNYSQDSHNNLIEDYRFEQIEEEGMLLADAKHIFSIIKGMQFVSGGSCTINNNDVYTFGKRTLIRKAAPKQINENPFYISRFLITREQWQAVMGKDNDPSEYSVIDKYLPVYNVSYENCQRFIIKLNRITGLRFSLPTSAQWDYAAHGGNNGCYDFQGKDRCEIDELSWFEIEEPMPIGSKPANPLGLYDMYGNIGEYCLREDGTEDIIKGGNIISERVNNASGFYHYEDYWTENDNEKRVGYVVKLHNHGFRLVLNLEDLYLK